MVNIQDEKETTEEEHPFQDYRFLNYRLNQLELNLRKGIEKIETDNQTYNTQLMQTLQQLQTGQSKTYEAMAQIKQRQDNLEEKMACVESLKKNSIKHDERIKNVNDNTNHRIDVIQKILFIVASTAIGAAVTAIFSVVVKVL